MSNKTNGGSSSREMSGQVRHRTDRTNGHGYPSPLGGSGSSSSYPSTSRKGKGKAVDEGIDMTGRRTRRALVRECFRRFGEHCARNQIRTLLIDCLVMTNLFYPSLTLYLRKKYPPLHPPARASHLAHRISPGKRVKEHPLSLLSTPILDSFFPYPPPLLPRIPWSGWWDSAISDPSGSTREGWHAQRLEKGDTVDTRYEDEIRLVRVGWADVDDVLSDRANPSETEARAWTERDFALVRIVREMAEDWERQSVDGSHCVRHLGSSEGAVTPSGECYIWPSREPPPWQTTTLGTTNATVTAADWDVQGGDIYHGVSAVFAVPRTAQTAFDLRWEEMMAVAAKKVEGEVFVEASGPSGFGAERTGNFMLSHQSSTEEPASESAAEERSLDGSLSTRARWLVGTFYVVLIGGLAGHVYWASRVHSRFGLAFTGIVQLTCSSIMSFSILALLGWNGWGSSRLPTTLPTYILPFVIVVVGAENMSTLTKAVFSIPFTYSVPVRIGLGLSKVGTTISFTSLTDIFILSLVWFFVNLRPVREFCVFAAVVITVDWFMLHTFFLTILSIDAQRLELADVLAAPDGPTDAKPEDVKAAIDAETSRGYSWRSVLRARSARMTSLVFLLCFVGALYWYTERHRAIVSPIADLYGYTPSSGAPTFEALVSTPVRTTLQDLRSLNPSELFWRALNPLGYARIPISIPAASIIIMPKVGHPMLPAKLRDLTIRKSRNLLPRLKPLFYLFKVVILPQAVTVVTLWGILLFLLKDAELLDAQRDRMGRRERDPHEDTIELQDNADGTKEATNLKGYALPCSHNADVDMIASSEDGKLAISLGLDNSVILWRFDERGSGTREVIATDPSLGPILHAAIGTQRAIALCSASYIAVFESPEDSQLKQHATISLPSGTTATGLAYHLPSAHPDDPFTSPRASLDEQPATLLVACSDGAVYSVDGGNLRHAIPAPELAGFTKVMFIRPTPSPQDLHILVISHSKIWFYTSHGETWHRTRLGTQVESNDRITCADLIRVGHDAASFIALGYRSGLIDILGIHGQHMHSLGPSGDPIISLSSAAPEGPRCSACASGMADGFYLFARSSKRTDIYRGVQHGVSPCRCNPVRPLIARSASNEAILQRTERIPSLVIPPPSPSHRSPGGSPRKAPSLLPPTSNGDFPLSSHGTRRHSNIHRDEGADSVAAQLLSPNAANGTPSWADIGLHPLGGIDTTQGNSSVVGDYLLGMRRRGRGIDDEGWQVWTLDLMSPWNGHMLSARSINLQRLFDTTPVDAVEVGMKDRRAQRLLSMSGRSPFPLPRGARDDFTIPTYQGMAYAQVGPMLPLADGGAMVGLGNRLAMVRLPQREKNAAEKKNGVGRGRVLSNGNGVNITPPPKRAEVSESKKIS